MHTQFLCFQQLQRSLDHLPQDISASSIQTSSKQQFEQGRHCYAKLTAYIKIIRILNNLKYYNLRINILACKNYTDSYNMI